VLTDSFHKPGFKLHAVILQRLFALAEGDGPVVISVPLWDVAALGPTAYPTNAAFVRQHVTQLLSASFPNMAPPVVRACPLACQGRAQAGSPGPRRRGGPVACWPHGQPGRRRRMAAWHRAMPLGSRLTPALRPAARWRWR